MSTKKRSMNWLPTYILVRDGCLPPVLHRYVKWGSITVCQTVGFRECRGFNWCESARLLFIQGIGVYCVGRCFWVILFSYSSYFDTVTERYCIETVTPDPSLLSFHGDGFADFTLYSTGLYVWNSPRHMDKPGSMSPRVSDPKWSVS